LEQNDAVGKTIEQNRKISNKKKVRKDDDIQYISFFSVMEDCLSASSPFDPLLRV
tara:strand:+ start:599 stop:763 length:165 start_codon:yes stop_codon:yes gene_type:complete